MWAWCSISLRLCGLQLIENVMKLIMFTLSCVGWTRCCGSAFPPSLPFISTSCLLIVIVFLPLQGYVSPLNCIDMASPGDGQNVNLQCCCVPSLQSGRDRWTRAGQVAASCWLKQSCDCSSLLYITVPACQRNSFIHVLKTQCVHTCMQYTAVPKVTLRHICRGWVMSKVWSDYFEM